MFCKYLGFFELKVNIFVTTFDHFIFFKAVTEQNKIENPFTDPKMGKFWR